MRLARRTVLTAVLAAGGLAVACTDVPFAPKWDADWTVPLPLTPISLSAVFSPLTTVPPGASAPVAIPVQQQSLDQAIGQVLKQDLRRAILKLNYTMLRALAGADTVFVAASPADLTNPVATRIVFPIALAQTGAAGTDVVDTLDAGSPQLAMLQNAASESGSGTLYVQVRGNVRNPSASSSVTIQSGDVIGLAFQLTVRIPVSK
jgi:hypothetical protein